METYNLEERLCVQCTKPFKVLATSKQRFCSEVCKDVVNPDQLTKTEKAKRAHYRLNSALFSELNAKANEKKKDGTMIQNIVNAKKRNEERIIKQTKKENVKEKERPIETETQKKNVQDELNGRDETRKDNLNTKGSTMLEIKSDKENSSTNERKSITPVMVSTSPSTTVQKELLQSTNLIDNTAKHLLDLMKGVTGHTNDNDNGVYDPFRVNAACNCAKQIYHMMQSKIQIAKLLKDL